MQLPWYAHSPYRVLYVKGRRLVQGCAFWSLINTASCELFGDYCVKGFFEGFWRINFRRVPNCWGRERNFEFKHSSSEFGSESTIRDAWQLKCAKSSLMCVCVKNAKSFVWLETSNNSKRPPNISLWHNFYFLADDFDSPPWRINRKRLQLHNDFKYKRNVF